MRRLRERPDVLEALEVLTGYTMNTSEVERDRFRRYLSATLGKKAGEVVMTTAEKLRVEGRRETLLEMLEERFGVPSEETRVRVEGATLAQLKAWTRQILSASALEEVFAGPS